MQAAALVHHGLTILILGAAAAANAQAGVQSPRIDNSPGDTSTPMEPGDGSGVMLATPSSTVGFGIHDVPVARGSVGTRNDARIGSGTGSGIDGRVLDGFGAGISGS